MFRTFANAWKIKDIRNKLLFTIAILIIYRIGCYIPVPGVNSSYIASQVGNYDILGFLNLFSGGALSQMTVFALGITPYINASIIMNLLTIAIPPLERLAKEEDGPKKIEAITRYVGIGLALVEAVGIILSLGPNAVTNSSILSYVTIVLCLTAGAALVMWLGERINVKGIGNGISMIIFISIVSRVPSAVIALFNNAIAGTMAWWILALVIVLVLALIVAVTFIDMGERRIPVQYAKRVVGRKQYGGQSTFIPMKVNPSGVLPLIFASTFMQFPSMLCQIFWPDSAFYKWWTQYLGSGTIAYMVIYALLILFFAYFYSQIAFNPIDVSKNLQQYGGFIPGIRPGKPTSDYLARILSRITLFSAIFLAIMAAVPTLLGNVTGSSSIAGAFGATSILIMVSVALETSRAIESQMMMRNYKGFLN